MKQSFLTACVALLFYLMPWIGMSQSTITANGPTTFCQGGSVVLSGNVLGVWSNLAITPSITVTTSGDYFVINANIFGDLVSNHIIVTVIPQPTPPLVVALGLTNLCLGGSVVLTGNTGGGTWNTGATTASITVSTPGDYFVTNTNACGSVNSNHIIVTLNPLLVAPVISAVSSVVLCAGASVTLQGNVGGIWNTGASTASITVSAAGDYFVTKTDLCGLVTSNHIIVTVKAALVPPVISAVGSISLCAGASVTLLGNVGGIWNTGSLNASIIVSTPGDYFVTKSDSCGLVTSNHIIVSVKAALVPPVISAAGSISLCAGASVTLLGNAGGIWSTGALGASIVVSTPGDYFVTKTDSCGLVTSNHIIVTAKVALVAPVISAVGSISLCAGASVTLLGNVGGIWNTGALGASIVVSTPGDYYVTKTDSCGLVTSNHIIVTAKVALVAPVISAVGSISLCAGASVTLLGNVGGIWNTGALGASIVVSTPGDYYVTKTDSCGLVTSNHIIVTAKVALVAPVISAVGSLSLCAGASVTLLGNVGGIWNTGALGASIVVSTPGDYYVTKTDSCGLVTSNHIIVTAKVALVAPVISAVGSLSLCAGASVTLLGNIGGKWSTGALGASIVVSTPGDYYVTKTDSCGLVTSNHIIVTAKVALVAPVISAIGSLSLCAGASVTLLGNIGGIWSTGALSASIVVTTAGDYFVTKTDSCGLVTSNHIIVTLKSGLIAPVISAVGSINLCVGASVTLLGNVGGIWSTGALTASIVVSTAGDYFVTKTDSCGLVTSNHIKVTIKPLLVAPVISAIGSINLCAGASVTLLGNVGGIWSTGALTAAITVSAAGDYFVNKTDSCGFVTSNHIIVTVKPLLVAPVISAVGSVNLCLGASVTLLGNVGGIWSTGALTPSIVVSTAGDYFVTKTDSCGNVTSNHIIVTVNPGLVPPTITANGTIKLCIGASVTLLGNVGGIWSTGAITASIVVSAAGDYFVTKSDACGSVTSNHIIVTVNNSSSIPPPVITANGSTSLCGGSTVTLSGNVGGIWSTGSITPSIVVSTAGDYFVTRTDSCGSVTSNHILVTINPGSAAPVISANGSIILCAGASVTLSGNLGGTWNTGAITPSIIVSTAGDYFVTRTDSCGLKTSNHIIVTVNPNAIPSVIFANGSVNLCGGASVTLSGNAGGTWSTGAITPSITVSTPGDYFVSNSNTCNSVSSNHIIVTTNPSTSVPPDITANGSTILCIGATVTLSGNTGGTWSTGATTPSIVVSTAGDYFVSKSDSCGSVTSNHIIVTISSGQNASTINANGATTFCSGDSVVLSGNNGGVWNTGAGTPSIVVKTSGDYFVTNPCDNSTSNHIQVIVNSTTPLFITANSKTNLCAGESVTLSGNNGGIWNTGGTAPTNVVTVAGDYFVITSSICGLVLSNHIIVTVSAKPTQSTIFASGATTLCSGSSVVLSGNVGGTWNTGATTPSITVTTGGDYFVINKSACDSVISNHIQVTAAASSSSTCIITSTGSFCQSNSIKLCAALGFASYLWNTGATTSCITVSQPGTYSVTVTEAGGCISTCSKTINADSAPVCEISGDTILQDGQSNLLCAPAGCNVTYLWSTGATTRCILVNQAGNYSVTVTSSDGCSSTCSKHVGVSITPNCLITGDDLICQGTTTDLCAPEGAGYSYLWSTGETTACISINCAGIYNVRVTRNGISNLCSKTVQVIDLPPFTIQGNSNLCEGSTTSLCAPLVEGCTYLWSNGATSRCISVSAAGTYSVTMSKFGCSVTSAKTIKVNAKPVCNIVGNLNPGQGDSTVLCAPPGMSSYHWSTGATTSCITVFSSGIYSVKISNSSGCNSTCQVNVNFSSSINKLTPGLALTVNHGKLEVKEYPNPFNDHAVIEFNVPESNARVVVELCNLMGNKIATLFDGITEKGSIYKAEIAGDNLAAGTYIYRIVYDDQIVSRKIVLIK